MYSQSLMRCHAELPLFAGCCVVLCCVVLCCVVLCCVLGARNSHSAIQQEVLRVVRFCRNRHKRQRYVAARQYSGLVDSTTCATRRQWQDGHRHMPSTSPCERDVHGDPHAVMGSNFSGKTSLTLLRIVFERYVSGTTYLAQLTCYVSDATALAQRVDQ